jgi:HAMP domain-containing protein
MEAKKTVINQKEEKKNRIWISIWEYLEGVFEPQRQLHQDLKVTFIETIHRFSITDPDARWQVTFEPGKEGWRVSTPKDKESQTIVAESQTIVEKISQSDDKVYLPKSEDSTIMKAYSLIFDRSGSRTGILGVEIKTDNIKRHQRLILLKMLSLFLITILFGILVALFISEIITRKIWELNESAKVIAEGNYDRRVDIRTIQEIIDLGNTFNTMSSVLEEAVSRTKRALIDSEQFRTEVSLAQTYNETLWEPLEEVFGNVEVVARLIPERPIGCFLGVFEVSGRIYAIQGRMEAKENLEAVTLASVAYSFIREELNTVEPDRVFKDVCELFDVQTWQCIYWTQGENEIQCLDSTPDSEQPQRRTIPLQEQKSLAFHTLGRSADGRIDLFICQTLWILASCRDYERSGVRFGK